MASSILPFKPVFAIICTVDSGGTVSKQLTRGCTVIEAVCIPTADSAGATMQISRSTDGTSYSTLTNAMACAATSTVARASTLTVAQSVFASGDYIRSTPATSAEGIVNVFVTPSAISGD